MDIHMSINELFGEYQEMVEAEYYREEDAGTFNVPHSSELGGPKSAEYVAARARCMKYWPLKTAKTAVDRSNDYHASSLSLPESELDNDKVLTMMVLSQAYEILMPETRQKYSSFLITLRLRGLINSKLLKKYGLFESYYKALAAEVTV